MRNRKRFTHKHGVVNVVTIQKVTRHAGHVKTQDGSFQRWRLESARRDKVYSQNRILNSSPESKKQLGHTFNTFRIHQWHWTRFWFEISRVLQHTNTRNNGCFVEDSFSVDFRLRHLCLHLKTSKILNKIKVCTYLFKFLMFSNKYKQVKACFVKLG